MRVRRTEQGYRVSLGRRQRQLLRSFCADLADRIRSGEHYVWQERLFPPAYLDDAEAAGEFEQLVRPDLERSKVEALETTAETADREYLDEPTIEAWLHAITDLRLVYGTLLQVDESALTIRRVVRDPDFQIYGLFTHLQQKLVEALAA